MTRTTMRRLRLLGVATAVLIALCARFLMPSPADAATYASISGAGSTWSYNAIHDWINNVNPLGITVNYSQVGSSTGRQEFAQGSVDFGASEIPYGVHDGANTDNPPTSRGFAYMPDTAGGTVFMYNLHVGGQQITDLRLSGSVITKIFTNQITSWNNSAIAADNPGLSLPNEPIVPVVRSDGSGATAMFTQWMLATEQTDYCNYYLKIRSSPCTQTSAYPVQSGQAMIAQPGDLGVSGYVSQPQAEGTIGYVEYSYAKQTHFPVAKVLNADGYYTEPTPGHIAVSLLKAVINQDKADPSKYLTQDLSGVYTDMDPRTYELSGYSYMILPTTSNFGLTSTKGRTLGAFGQFLLCQGQRDVDGLGYSALPINLVEAGFTQLQKIPGNQVPNQTAKQIQQCPNPTFAANGTNLLADNDPDPPACDHVGHTMCTTGTGGAPGGTNPANGPGNSSGNPNGGGPGGGGPNGGGPNGGGPNGASPTVSCDPNTGVCSTVNAAGYGGTSCTPSATVSSSPAVSPSPTVSPTHAVSPSPRTSSSRTATTAHIVPSSPTASTSSRASPTPTASRSATASPSATTASPSPTATCYPGANDAGDPNANSILTPAAFTEGMHYALMVLAAALLVGSTVMPPLVSQLTARRRRLRGPGSFYGGEDRR